MSIQQGKVKHCLSGDTVVLHAVGNPRSERTLSLAHVAAPRLRRDADEPFGVEARDFIRTRLVGKVIQFRVLYTIPTGANRQYGTITLQDGASLPDLAVAEGWLKLRDDAGKRDGDEEATAYTDKLRALEAKAKADGKGLWDPSATPVQTLYEVPDPQAFVKQAARQPMDAIVEKVITGDRVIVRLKQSPTKHYQTILLLAGVRAPSLKRTNPDGSSVAGEPLSEEALDFVNTRMMQRGCQVVLYGASDSGQLIGSVVHPNGSIAEFLIKEGLARSFDHHSTLMGTDMAPLRQAEKHAREKKLGLFRNVTTKAAAHETDVVVSRVFSADTLFLRYPDGKERRIGLSSVRQPKPSDLKQAPFGAPAKEFVRKRLIGKHVKVAVDGKRAANEGFEERELATVVQGGQNVALALVEAGYATVIRHKMDDPDRSPIYDDLRLAEDAAQKAGAGLWAPKPPEVKAVVNYSENLEKARRLLSLLQRQKRVPAVVDFVMGGSRFALLIPRENARITFVLSGVQVPRNARISPAGAPGPESEAEPFGQEAYELAVRRLQQRDVEIDVEDNDKNGGFIGKLYVNRDNFARTLLEEGYAAVRTRSAEKSGNLAELAAAEKAAQDARKGQWHDYDAAAAEEAAAAEANGNGNGNGYAGADYPSLGGTNGHVEQQPTSTDYRDVYVTHVDEATCRLRIQQVGTATTVALEKLMAALRGLDIGASAPLAGPPKTGDLVVARFSEDGTWYRARVRRVDRDAKTAEVLYVDYGNAEARPWAELKALPAPERFGAAALRYQAAEAALSFVSFPSAPDYLRDAQGWLLARAAAGQQLVARVDYTDARDGTLYVSLIDPAAPSADALEPGLERGNVNAELLTEGLAMVSRKLARWERGQPRILESLRRREASAKEARRGMWEFGDITED